MGVLTGDIRATLEQHFSKLNAPVVLVAKKSSSAYQSQLESLLEETASTHPMVLYELLDESSPLPHFSIYKDGSPTGISFTGLPTGHEFSSLVLAILHVSGEGKQLDDVTKQRIKRLKGPVHFKTYISLSCTNCPLIVQAMNLITSLHPDISHTMVDGGLAEEEFESLNASSVPSVYDGTSLVHAGRATLAELLSKLEAHLGSQAPAEESLLGEKKHYDVVVVGGGPAGVSAAIYTSRKGMKTAIVAEALGGQLNETQGIENFISVIYTQGAQLAGQMKEHLHEYPVDILEHRLVESMGVEESGSKVLVLSSGETLVASQVIVATGARWRELGVAGEKEYLGKGVAYCPHCDGPYFKGKDVIVVGGGNSGVEAAIDLSGMVKSVTLFEFQDSLKADKVLVDVLNARENTTIMTSVALKSVEGDGKVVSKVKYLDRKDEQEKELETSAVFVQIGLIPNSQFLKGVVELSEYGEVIVDEKNRTSQSGIYATGDVTTIPYKQIIISMGDGAKAALAAFEDSILA